MATITLYPAAFDTTNSTYSSIASSYTADNVVGNSASTTSSYGVGVGLVTGSGAATSAYFTFDTSSIPEGATINSVSCLVGIYGTASFTTRTNTRYILLCKGTTATGTSTTFTTGSSAGTVIPEITAANGGTWTRKELDNLKVLVYVTRSSSNTTSNTYVYVRGIDLVIDYTEPNPHTLTVINDTDVTVDPATTTEYGEGTVVPITITGELPTVTLDGTDITDLFTEASSGGSISVAPAASSYTGLSSGSSYVAYAVGRTAESPYSSTSNYYGSSSATVDSCYAQYTFDTSAVPSNATNIKVSCVVAGHAESPTYSHQYNGRYSVWALCSDGTEKSELVYTTSTSNTTISIAETEWTYEELQNLQLRHYVGYYGGGTVGATLTVTYLVAGDGNSYVYNLVMDDDHTLELSSGVTSSDVLHVKVNGIWKSVNKAYLKVSGSWVEITDLQTFFADYSNGGYSDFVKG